MHSTLCLKKRHPFIFWITLWKNIQFWWFLVQSILKKLTPEGYKVPISPVYCGRTTLKSAKKSYFNNVIDMFQIFRLGYSS